MKNKYFFSVIAVSLILAGCGRTADGLAGAITDPLNPKVKGQFNRLTVGSSETNSLLPSENDTITITDSEKSGADRVKTYRKGETIDISYKKTGKITGLEYELNHADQTKENGELLIYKQNYSVVAGRHPAGGKYPDGSSRPVDTKFEVNTIQGTYTAEDKLPTGKIRYEGKAFAGGDDRNGKLDYTIDFGQKTGEGSITGLKGVNKVMLENHRLHARPDGTVGVDGGRAVSSGLTGGSYGLTLYGPQADELAGSAYFSNGGNSKQIGFGGSQKK